MESSDLSMPKVTLRVIEAEKISRHDDVHISYSCNTDSFHLKQTPELDSSGVHIAYHIHNTHLQYQDDTTDEDGATTVHLETKAPIQAHIAIPENERVDKIHEHEVTVAMFCTISTEAVPVEAKLHIVIDANEPRDKIDLLIATLQQIASPVCGLGSSSSSEAELSDTTLKLSNEELDFLEKCGTRSTDQTAPTLAAAPATKAACFEPKPVDDIEARTVADSSHARNDIVREDQCQAGSTYKLNANGNIVQPARGTKQIILQSGPQKRCFLDATEQTRYEEREAQREDHRMRVKGFFSEEQPKQSHESRPAHNKTALRSEGPADITKQWQAFASSNSDNHKRLLSNAAACRTSGRPNEALPVDLTNCLFSARGRIIQPPSPPLSNEAILASLQRSESPILPRGGDYKQNLGAGSPVNGDTVGNGQDRTEQNENTDSE